MRGHFDSLEDVVGPAAQRTADWLVDGMGTVRDALAQGFVFPSEFVVGTHMPP